MVFKKLLDCHRKGLHLLARWLDSIGSIGNIFKLLCKTLIESGFQSGKK